MQKGGGKMADGGSVMFNFQRAGVILVEPTLSEDEVRAFVQRGEDALAWYWCAMSACL